MLYLVKVTGFRGYANNFERQVKLPISALVT